MLCFYTVHNVFRGCHIQQLITPEVFVIEASCLQFLYGQLIVNQRHVF